MGEGLSRAVANYGKAVKSTGEKGLHGVASSCEEIYCGIGGKDGLSHSSLVCRGVPTIDPTSLEELWGKQLSGVAVTCELIAMVRG